jgi:type III pantothenate kinase
MRRLLVIDQGNSSTKIIFFEGDEIICSQKADNEQCTEQIMSLIAQWSPEGAIYSSVAHVDIRLIETLRTRLNGNLLAFTSRTPVPLTIDYLTPNSLGTDRIGGAVGAAYLYPDKNMLLADIGSAITYDIVQAGGIFKGGNISPGLGMRLKALSTFTGHLPRLYFREGDEFGTFGKCTDDAIRNGVVNGLIAEINSFIEMAIKEEKCELIILTGGNAALFAPYLNLENTPVVILPELVSIGLKQIYLYNEEN